MMVAVAPTVGLIVLAAGIAPQGEPQGIHFAKKRLGFILTDAGLTYEIEGPGALIFELRGDKALRGRAVQVEIVRDAGHVSKNAVRLKKKAGGPKSFPLRASLGVVVPEGRHTVVLLADEPLAVWARKTLRLAKRLPVAAAWETLPNLDPLAPPQPEVAAQVPSSTSASAAEVGTAAPTSGVRTGAAASAEPPPTPGDGSVANAESESPAATVVAAPGPAQTQSETETAVEPKPQAETKAEAEAGAEVIDANAEAANLIALAPPSAAELSPPKTGLDKALRVAVYSLKLEGIEPNIGNVVTDSLLAEVRKLQGVSAIGMDEIQDMLSHEANKQILGCEADDGCLAEIAGALGVDNLITGKLSKAADSHALLVRRIDQHRATVLRTVNKRLKAGSGQEFLLAVGPTVEELFDERPIRMGLERGVPDEVALRLDPPPLPTWSFWSTAGAAVAVGAAGGVFGLLARTSQDEYNRLEERGQTQPIAGEDLTRKGRDVDSYSTTANTLLISAGVVAVAAGVMYLFTNWEGYGDEPP